MLSIGRLRPFVREVRSTRGAVIAWSRIGGSVASPILFWVFRKQSANGKDKPPRAKKIPTIGVGEKVPITIKQHEACGHDTTGASSSGCDMDSTNMSEQASASKDDQQLICSQEMSSLYCSGAIEVAIDSDGILDHRARGPDIQCLECGMIHGHYMDTNVIHVSTDARHIGSLHECGRILDAIGNVLRHMRAIIGSCTGCGEYSPKGGLSPLLLRDAFDGLLLIDALRPTIRTSVSNIEWDPLLLQHWVRGILPSVDHGCLAIGMLCKIQHQVTGCLNMPRKEKLMPSSEYPHGREECQDALIERKSCPSLICNIPENAGGCPPIFDDHDAFLRMTDSAWPQSRKYCVRTITRA